ncbi:methyltransferase type 11 [Achromobacter spanius]|uniref:Methyltransferase type 11 n=2 Tax=Achromobacter spanius TaxID=217203 RepID=A0ABY8GVA1_9BURK|nr:MULTISPECIES: methyltransferase domain-containing protein [Achromobacter]WEX92061.1 methyltransferase type 11 [Achromobacter sp. SS2-2022]WFP08790.1 methyltransferase type 11 [Achromobacter spanius]
MAFRYPYYPVVIDILRSRGAEQVLDAPCGVGWLGEALSAGGGGQVTGDGGQKAGDGGQVASDGGQKAEVGGQVASDGGPVAKGGGQVAVDGVGLWEFPPASAGYRSVTEHDLDTPLSVAKAYDAVVCCEAIHLMTSPGVMLQSLHDALRPGGTVIITTPNTWNMRSRLQFLMRGFHSGFRPMVGRKRGEDYITYFPWSFPQLHLLLSHYGFVDITLHEVDEPKPKRMLEHVLAVPSRFYYRRRVKRAEDADIRGFWKQAGSSQSVHGRWLVVSARRAA